MLGTSSSTTRRKSPENICQVEEKDLEDLPEPPFRIKNFPWKFPQKGTALLFLP
jgi:hypothetical protein